MNRRANQASQRRRPPLPRVPVTIRLPENVVEQIDRDLGQRDIPLSRNNWFLEAVIEKLRRNAPGGANGAK